MNAFVDFVSDSKVHDSVLLTMVVTSCLSAIRRFKSVDNDPIAPGFYTKVKLVWNFFYDWITSFWSMKTGQPLPSAHIQTSEQTATTSKIEEATLTGVVDPPTTPVAIPAPTK